MRLKSYEELFATVNELEAEVEKLRAVADAAKAWHEAATRACKPADFGDGYRLMHEYIDAAAECGRALAALDAP